MHYRKFNADNLFDGHQLLGNDVVLITTNNGVVQEIVSKEIAGENIEVFQGLLTPGLINCHCHLELSHLKDAIPPHTGLIEFLVSVVQKRGFAPAIIQEAITRAEQEMYNNGIVAVGDICNTADAVETKYKSKIRWQSFIEVLSFTDDKTDHWMQHYKTVLQLHNQKLHPPHRSVLTPHAPYTISPKTFAAINAATENQIISVHNQEHPAENELYRTGEGEYLKLFKIFGLNQSPFPITGKSSLQSYLPHFNNGQTIFLIHNTYMPEEDIVFASEYASDNSLTLVYCLCINANLYIENKTPPVELFMNNNCHLVLGTDSYSSNWQLDIVKEMASIQTYFPHISTDNILQWATINGAKALRWDDELGSFEKGKQPGVVLIENIEENKFTEKSAARRIL